jgi:DNA repair protein RadA/Sms
MKQKTVFVCQSCGNESPKWIGKCPGCGEWNKYVEEKAVETKEKKHRSLNPLSNGKPKLLDEIDSVKEIRIKTNSEEFDRVMGGGIVEGSVTLIAGDPGIGKSTLMLQIAQNLPDRKVLYVSGEESLQQIKLRAERINSGSRNFYILTESNIDTIINAMDNLQPEIVIVDSIQTMYKPDFDSPPGSISQIRECSATFLHIAKSNGPSIFLIGHITKEGAIAGPKILEHIVDCVLQFEGDNNYSYRILRAAKNRFGSTNEIGIFEMGGQGLKEVKNPSEVFLSQRQTGTSGNTIVATIEGTRPILVEVQALVSSTSYGMPQRSSIGFDYRRLSIIIAVIEKRLGLRMGQYDVIANIAGGVKIDEPAVDLAVLLSIVSSYKDIATNSNTVIIGEVGLSGEVRTVSFIEKRLQEVKKLGFQRVIIPKNNLKEVQNKFDMEILAVENIKEALENAI